MSGKTLAFSNDELPDEAWVGLETRKIFGVQSSVAIPLSVGGQPIFGIISFDTLKRTREWSEHEVQLLKLVADVFANALSRKNTERALVESEERLTITAESAEAGLWEMDISNQKFWATDQARILFDYSSEEELTYALFEQPVLKEDWEIVKTAIAESFNKKKRLYLEYRVVDKEGAMKWICSRGKPYFSYDGLPSRMLGVSVDISEKKRMEEELRTRLAEVEFLKQQIEQENFYLREELRTEQGFEDVVGKSKAFRAVLSSAQQVAPTDATVLLLAKQVLGKA